MGKAYWIPCPKCGYKHFIKRRKDTVLINFPAWCKGCKKEYNVSIRAKEPEFESIC